MKISHDIPPIYQKLHDTFGVNWSKGIIITYGDTVYCKYDLSQPKYVHEATHVKQQTAMGKDIWWDKYLADPKFRLEQELEAYSNEVWCVKDTIKDRNLKHKWLHSICKDLSGHIYGNIISFEKAKELLKI